MKKKRRQGKYTPAYSTYSLLSPDSRDPVTGAPIPDEASIELAKRTTDSNEK